MTQPLRLPPAPLPRRHIFWREEMADGVIESDKEPERGVKDRLDWYRYKANQMRFLGINTFTQGPAGVRRVPALGLDAATAATTGSTSTSGRKDLWAQIVALMGQQGFGVLPYYEYAGSKGEQGPRLPAPLPSR